LRIIRLNRIKNSQNIYNDSQSVHNHNIQECIRNSIENIKNSVFIEKLTKKDYEILFMCDPLDEYIMQQIHEYENKKLLNVVKDNLNINDKEDNESNKEKYTELCEKFKEILEKDVSRVVISNKLESHPAIVVNPMGWSANMERIMRAQALSNNQFSPFMNNQKVLEINVDHKLIQKFIDSNYDIKLGQLIFKLGLLAGGYELSNVNNFLIDLYGTL
jgi:molecular chaperone HtpG